VLWLLYPYRIITLSSTKHNGDDAPLSRNLLQCVKTGPRHHTTNVNRPLTTISIRTRANHLCNRFSHLVELDRFPSSVISATYFVWQLVWMQLNGVYLVCVSSMKTQRPRWQVNREKSIMWPRVERDLTPAVVQGVLQKVLYLYNQRMM